MVSILSSPAVVLATAVAVSGTVIFLARRREKNFPPSQFSGNQDSRLTKQILRPCISSDGKKRGSSKKKKKKVQFAEGVKDKIGNGEEYRKEQHKRSSTLGTQRSCRGEIQGMPENRVALYSGILRDRLQRMDCSY